MGSWSVHCGISKIAITSGNKCVLLPLKKNKYSESRQWQAATLPIFGEYNDYGSLEEDSIEVTENTKLIEDYFGVSIMDFVTFLVDGKFTYNRGEAKEVSKRIKNLEEIKEWRFMWIDRQVYDFMTTMQKGWYSGHNDYGKEKMMKLLGFEFVGESQSYKNYDPKRFKYLWRKGDVEVFTDGNTMLSKDSRYIYNFGHGDESSLETYFDVPEELHSLKELHQHETWWIMDEKDAIDELCEALADRYSFDYLKYAIPGLTDSRPKKLFNIYYENLPVYGDELSKLVSLNRNLHPMSGELAPQSLYLTPQCGEYPEHQKILEKFAEINKSYLMNRYEDDYIFVNVEEIVYKPSCVPQTYEIEGVTFTGFNKSPNVFVVKSKELKDYDSGSYLGLSFKLDGIMYDTEDPIVTQKGDLFFIECRNWKEEVVKEEVLENA